jgi:hypothetical protein
MMTRTARITLVLSAMLSAGLAAQEVLGPGAPEPAHRGGWTFTPRIGFSETYDDNISLFGRGSAEEQNDDFISTIIPAADLHYASKHTAVDMGYSGSFLNYRTFSVLNRWDQSAKFEVKRQESARLKWGGRASMAMIPSTDLIELGGIPYRHTGARTSDARGGFDYALNAKNSLSQSANFQTVAFDRPQEVDDFLRGGRIFGVNTGYRRKMSGRMAIGADYSFRRAAVVDDPEPFNIQTTEAALDYDLSPSWSFNGAAGFVHLQATALTPSQTGPAWRLRIDRHRDRRTFHAGYIRSYIPSFGFGGTVSNQEFAVGYRTPLFGSRRFYLDNSAIYRDNEPLAPTPDQLPLRSLRTHSVFGWEPQPWVRIEGFYSLVQQSSLRAGGRLARNRIGFQIVTSKPVRMQ